MKVVTLQNPGLIDLRAVQFMGVNAKDNDNPIGYFGTGLKFAIATLLRSGHEVILWRGLDKYEFTARSEVIRDKAFRLIYMNDQPLGITTDLGKNWKCWMAMREIYSNMLDEKGESSPAELQPKEGCTTIQVFGAPFYDEYLKRGEVFLENRQPIVKSEGLEVYEGKSPNLFYRGIRVNPLDKPSVHFTYNLLAPAELSEDRMLVSHFTFEHLFIDTVLSSTNKEFIKRVINIDADEQFESRANYLLAGVAASATFLDAVEESPRATLNKSAFKVWLRSSRGKDVPEFETFELTEQDQQRINKAKAAIRRLGYTDDYPLVFVMNLGNTSRGQILGMARDEKIYLAKRVFEMGTKQLASCLYEEWVHLKYSYSDRSLAMQNFLFDKVISLVEELNGEVL